MTLNYGIFDVSDPQNPDRVYSAALLSRILSKHIRDGVVHDDGNEMAVTVTDPPAMAVRVGTGTAMVQGRFCENDAALTLPVTTAHATYPRIDRVVVRLNASPGRTIDIVVKPGTAAPSPVPPTLTRTAEVWELSLAQVRVEAGATLIASSKIADERGDASLCGVAAPAYLPSSQVEVVGAMNMQGHALTGLPVPSGATDAARKGYVDSEIAGKIGGFGISQIAIDADKDWNGKSITNIGNLQAAAIYPRICTASDTVRRTVGSTSWTAYGGQFTGMQVLLSTMIPPSPYYFVNGKMMSVRVKFVHSTFRHQSNPTTTKSALLVDGVKVWESDAVPYGSPLTVSQDVNVDGGSLIEVACTSIAGGSGIADGIQITDLQICCTESFVAPSGW